MTGRQSYAETSRIATTSWRERKRLATRRAIHEAAFTLAEERGLLAMTVEAIADRAGVATRTFFNYFACKEDAILDRDPGRPEQVRQEVLACPSSEDALAALSHAISAELYRRVSDGESSFRRMKLIRSDPQLSSAMAGISEEYERALVTAVAERMGQDPAVDMYPALVVNAAWGAFRVAQIQWYELGGQVTLEELLEEAFDALSRGLSFQRNRSTRRGRRTPARIFRQVRRASRSDQSQVSTR